jgi:hypothetical protein
MVVSRSAADAAYGASLAVRGDGALTWIKPMLHRTMQSAPD